MDSSSDTEPGYDSEEEEKRWRLNNLRDALRDGKKKFNNQLKQVEEAVKDTNDFKQCVDNTSSILKEMNAFGVEVGWDAECMAIWMKVVAVKKECTGKMAELKNEKVEEKSKGGKRKKKRKTRRRTKKRKSKKRRPKRKHKRKTRRKYSKFFRNSLQT